MKIVKLIVLILLFLNPVKTTNASFLSKTIQAGVAVEVISLGALSAFTIKALNSENRDDFEKLYHSMSFHKILGVSIVSKTLKEYYFLHREKGTNILSITEKLGIDPRKVFNSNFDGKIIIDKGKYPEAAGHIQKKAVMEQVSG